MGSGQRVRSGGSREIAGRKSPGPPCRCVRYGSFGRTAKRMRSTASSTTMRACSTVQPAGRAAIHRFRQRVDSVEGRSQRRGAAQSRIHGFDIFRYITPAERRSWRRSPAAPPASPRSRRLRARYACARQAASSASTRPATSSPTAAQIRSAKSRRTKPSSWRRPPAAKACPRRVAGRDKARRGADGYLSRAGPASSTTA